MSVRDDTNTNSPATPVFLPYTQDIIKRIDDMRQQKAGNRTTEGNDDPHLDVCECGAMIVDRDMQQSDAVRHNHRTLYDATELMFDRSNVIFAITSSTPTAMVTLAKCHWARSSHVIVAFLSLTRCSFQ